MGRGTSSKNEEGDSDVGSLQAEREEAIRRSKERRKEERGGRRSTNAEMVSERGRERDRDSGREKKKQTTAVVR